MFVVGGGVSGIWMRKRGREREGERGKKKEREGGQGEREREGEGERGREGGRDCMMSFLFPAALELQPDDWLTMYYCGEVLGRQGKMEDSRDMFKLAAQTEITIH